MEAPEVPSPVDAATVILVRRGEPVGVPWQIFMVRRPIKSDFAADVYVFPGGKVDGTDYAAIDRVTLHQWPVPHEASPETVKAVRVAAVREVFEEVSVLLATREGRPLATENAAEWTRYQDAVHDGDISFADLLARENLLISGDALHPFSRWITPPVFRRRYDTRFFVAYMPPHQSPRPHATEIVESIWISPAEALARYRSGTFPLVFATEKHLEMLDRFRSIEDLIASTAAANLDPVVPRPVGEGADLRFVIPDVRTG